MKQKLFVVLSISKYLMICLLTSILVKMFISLTVHSSSFLFSRNFVIGMTLIAYSFWSLLLMARYTFPQTPEPISSYSAQFSMYFGISIQFINQTDQKLQKQTCVQIMDDSNPALIVDNGSGFIKVGIAGDDAPKSSFPTIIGRPKQPGQMVGMDQKDIYIGHQVTSKQGVLTLSRPIVDGVIQNWEDMQKMWHHGFLNELQMSPEDSPILLTQTPGNTKRSRQTLIQLMFQKFQVSSFYLALQQVLALYASGKTTGIVVDSGYSLTSTVPIYQGFALSHAIQKMNLAGSHLTEYLMSLMKEQGVTFSNIEETARFNARDTKQKCCYVATDYQGSLKQYTENNNKSIIHKLPDGNQIALRSQVFKCPEALFQPSKIVGKQLLGVHELTFQSILKCDSDIRKDIYGNIVIAGGTSMLKNLNDRLKKEVIALAPSTMKINVFDPPERKFSSWMGGSILASLSSFHPMFITKQEYNEGGPQYVHRKCF